MVPKLLKTKPINVDPGLAKKLNKILNIKYVPYSGTIDNMPVII